MAVQGIEGVMQQLRATALQAAAPETADRMVQPLGAGFASELKAAIDKVSGTQQAARQQAQAFELGAQGIGLNDVMVDLQKSSVSLQMSVQVRNRLVAAYQEIMNMQV